MIFNKILIISLSLLSLSTMRAMDPKPENEMLMRRFASNTLIIPNQPRLSQLTQIIADADALLEKKIATFSDPNARSRYIDVQAIKDDAQGRIATKNYRGN